MKVALVHDYLMQDGGAERVLLALHEMYPDAPIFTLFYRAERCHPDFQNLRIYPSDLNNFPFAGTNYEWYLPLMPQAIEHFDLTEYDLIISSSSSFAKGVIVAPHATHICYCHTPTRFLWQERIGYVNELPQPKFVKWILPHVLHALRQWDQMAAERPDVLLTNSRTSEARIKKYYRRASEVIHPPVDLDAIPFSTKPGRYWLAGGRLVAYKRFDLIVQAFTHLRMPLKIFGEGPEMKRLKKMAGDTIEFLGRVDEKVKRELYTEAIGFLYPQVEDFGITAVEAMAAGKPVIAFKRGGATETVVPGVTGEHFDRPSAEAIEQAVKAFNPAKYDPQALRNHAAKFSKNIFQQKMAACVEQALIRFPVL